MIKFKKYFLHPTDGCYPWLYASLPWLKYIPQPAWMQRFYYNISYYLFKHPSRYHWKRSDLSCNCITPIGHRCLWCGCYSDDYYSAAKIWFEKKYGGFVPNPDGREEYYKICNERDRAAFVALAWRRKPLKWFDNLMSRIPFTHKEKL